MRSSPLSSRSAPVQDVDEALKRLPVEVTDARNQRMKRAVDCSLKKSYLPKDLQDQQTPWAWYVRVSQPGCTCAGLQSRMAALQDPEGSMRACPIILHLGNQLNAHSCRLGQCTLQQALMLHSTVSGAQDISSAQPLSCLLVQTGEFMDMLTQDLSAAAGHVGTSPD